MARGISTLDFQHRSLYVSSVSGGISFNWTMFAICLRVSMA